VYDNHKEEVVDLTGVELGEGVAPNVSGGQIPLDVQQEKELRGLAWREMEAYFRLPPFSPFDATRVPLALTFARVSGW
jgi:hypothetical protein